MARHSKLRGIDAVALEIGLLCSHWAEMEECLALLLRSVAAIKPIEVAEAITANVDLRGRIQILKAVAFLRKPSDEWFEDVRHMLDYIDNDLRPQRNRLIHDDLRIIDRRVVRHTIQAKLSRPAPFKFALTTAEHTPVKPSDVRRLRKAVVHVIVEMARLWILYHDFPQLRSSPSKQIPQFLRRSALGARRKCVTKARQRPPRS